MSRGRLTPSLNYRSKGIIDISIRNELLLGYDLIEIWGASNITNCYNNPIKLFEVKVGVYFKSKGTTNRTMPVETNRDTTRMVFDLGDYSTTPPIPRIPTDNEVLYLTARGRLKSNPALFSDFGPIMSIPPYDFFTTAHPVFTFTGVAPSRLENEADPDTMLNSNSMNIHLPYFSHTISVVNLDPNRTMYLAFHPGTNPTLVPPLGEVGLTGGGAPELLISYQYSNQDSGSLYCKFTSRMVLVNHS